MYTAAVEVPRSCAGYRREDCAVWRPRPSVTRRSGHGLATFALSVMRFSLGGEIILTSTSAVVKGFGCRPLPDACRRAALGPASETLQRRKPRVGRVRIRRRELWGFESRPRLLVGGRNDHRSRFRRIEGGQGVLFTGRGMMFFAAAVLGRLGQRTFGRTPAARSKGARQMRAPLGRCERRDLNHDVSILISPSEKPREARRRSKVSMTIMRPPQHGHGCARLRGSD